MALADGSLRSGLTSRLESHVAGNQAKNAEVIQRAGHQSVFLLKRPRQLLSFLKKKNVNLSAKRQVQKQLTISTSVKSEASI